MTHFGFDFYWQKMACKPDFVFEMKNNIWAFKMFDPFT